MTKRMLIDSTHAEETRVVVLDGNRLEDYDVETSTKQQLKGNIYLAKVVRVEPSLQAAFVEYGGGRHGFLAFGEIHPDYYQIPVADRQRLMEMQEAEAREEEEAEDRAAAREARATERGGERGGDRGNDRANDRGGDRDSGRGSRGDGRGRGRGGAQDGRGAAAADGATQAAYALQADPEAAPELIEDAMPRPGQVAQAAAVSQDILVAPEDAQAEFPRESLLGSPGDEDGADMAPEGMEPAASDVNQPPTPDAADGGHEGGRSPASPPGPVDSPPEAGAADTITLDDGAAVPLDGAPAAHPDGTDTPDLDTSGHGSPDAAPSSAGLPGLDATGHDLPSFELPGEGAGEYAGASPDLARSMDSVTLDDGAPIPVDDLDAGYAGPSEPPPEAAGGADGDEGREPRMTPRFLRNYKIQEVIRRRQILLVQVVKEERGSKGAALTTYISLAGRFSVLMPNSPRGGGISRKITASSDRRRLKEVMTELDLPRGMGLIVRTAGAQRPKAEILRDGEYLLSQWDDIRELTMRSMAPALIYEEASLIKRAIRDVYSRDVDDILVDGEQGWRAARDFMRMLMPTHAKKVQLWKDPQPLFAKAQVEQQLDAMMLPTVQLRSGGYLVINQTEALVAIDVNSGRSTRERGIEETALRTNLEAAEEAARQLRLRDLAGLIVIDFIDMESRRNNAAVEKKLKDALRNDRARIQLGSISHFGLLEMSRQRLRPSLAETSFVTCPHCAGTGTVRSTESAALHVLRAVEEEGGKRRAAEIVVHVAGSIALYILNNKRVRLAEIEQRHGMKVSFAADESLLPPEVRIDRVRAAAASELPVPVQQLAPPEPFEDPDEQPPETQALAAPDEDGDEGEAGTEAESDASADAPRPGETAEEREQRGKRRRRRRRGGRRDDMPAGPEGGDAPAPGDAPLPVAAGEVPHEFDAVLAVGEAAMDGLPAPEGTEPSAPATAAAETASEEADRAKRRGRRGGRRRRRDGTEGTAEDGGDEAPAPAAQPAPAQAAPAYAKPAYSGPTPADPFGGMAAFDIFDAIEQAEQQRALAAFAPAGEPANPPASEPASAPFTALAPAADDAAEARLASDPVIDEMPLTAPVITLPEMVSVEDAAPSPAASAPPEAPAPVVTETPASEPAAIASLAAAAPEAAAAQPPAPEPAPAIVPLLVGASEPAERKRGWWKR